MRAFTSATIARDLRACAYESVDDFPSLGARLRALRTERGLAQATLGDLVGVRNQTIHRYEKGEVLMMEADVAIKIAEAVGTDVRWLISGDPPEVSAEGSAFAEFMQRIAPTLRPPLTLAERGKLVYMRHHQPSPERYLGALLREREGASPEDAKASDVANAAAKAKGAAWGVKPRRRK